MVRERGESTEGARTRSRGRSTERERESGNGRGGEAKKPRSEPKISNKTGGKSTHLPKDEQYTYEPGGFKYNRSFSDCHFAATHKKALQQAKRRRPNWVPSPGRAGHVEKAKMAVNMKRDDKHHKLMASEPLAKKLRDSDKSRRVPKKKL